MSDIVVFGASGQLGVCTKAAAGHRDVKDMLFLEDNAINILDRKSLAYVMAERRPKFLVNCVGLLAIDLAETEPELSKRLNTEGALNVAQLCAEYAVALIHLSTDYVFKGNIPKPLHERDYTEPLNAYGHTKLEGERIIATFQPEHIIIRTGWVYSEYGENFVKAMLQTAAEQDEICVPMDRVGSPVYGMDLANALLDIISANNLKYGIYHYSNEGVCSLYDFAKAIFDITKIPMHVKPVISNYYANPIKGPAFSVMDKTKIKATFGLSIPYWRDALETCLQNLLQHQSHHHTDTRIHEPAQKHEA